MAVAVTDRLVGGGQRKCVDVLDELRQQVGDVDGAAAVDMGQRGQQGAKLVGAAAEAPGMTTSIDVGVRIDRKLHPKRGRWQIVLNRRGRFSSWSAIFDIAVPDVVKEDRPPCW